MTSVTRSTESVNSLHLAPRWLRRHPAYWKRQRLGRGVSLGAQHLFLVRSASVGVLPFRAQVLRYRQQLYHRLVALGLSKQGAEVTKAILCLSAGSGLCFASEQTIAGMVPLCRVGRCDEIMSGYVSPTTVGRTVSRLKSWGLCETARLFRREGSKVYRSTRIIDLTLLWLLILWLLHSLKRHAQVVKHILWVKETVWVLTPLEHPP